MGESILNVIHDAADAEWPGVANFYIDRYGVVCFHGRNARFDPAATAGTATHWDFHAWDLGMGGAQVGPPWFVRRSSSLIRNSATCYPQHIEVPPCRARATTSCSRQRSARPDGAGHRLHQPARRPLLVGNRFACPAGPRRCRTRLARTSA